MFLKFDFGDLVLVLLQGDLRNFCLSISGFTFVCLVVLVTLVFCFAGKGSVVVGGFCFVGVVLRVGFMVLGFLFVSGVNLIDL